MALPGAGEGGPLVPVGNTNQDQKAATRQQLAVAGGFVFFGQGGLGFWRVNLGVSYCVSELIERSDLSFSVIGRL